MNFMKKASKGGYGYIRYEKKMEVIKTVFLFALSLAIYLGGLITTGTNKNLLTIVAILGCLPASRSAVSMIMFLKAKGCSAELHGQIAPHAKGLPQLYDNVLTSYEAAFEIPHLVFKGNSLVGIAVDPKCKVTACEKHIQDMCVQNAIHGVTVKIFTDTAKYADRLDRLQELTCEDAQTERVLSLIKAISL